MPQTLSTADVSVRERFDYWQDAVFRGFDALKVAPTDRETPFFGSMQLIQLADVRFRITIAQTRFPHHLFSVMCPAFGKSVTNKDLAKP